MEETEEKEVARHRQDILQRALFYIFLKHLTAFCLSSAKEGLVRHLDSCGSIWGITGTTMSGSFWTLITSYHGPQVDQLNLNFTHFIISVVIETIKVKNKVENLSC